MAREMMSLEEQLKELMAAITDALIFNRSLLPVFLKAQEQKITVKFMPVLEPSSSLIRVRLYRTFANRATLYYIDSLFDPEVLTTSVFYPRDKTDG